MFVIHAHGREGYPSTGLPFTTLAKPVNVAQHELPRRYELLCQPQRRPLRTMSSSHRSAGSMNRLLKTSQASNASTSEKKKVDAELTCQAHCTHSHTHPQYLSQ